MNVCRELFRGFEYVFVQVQVLEFPFHPHNALLRIAYTIYDEFYLTTEPGTYEILFSIDNPSLTPDRYTIGVGLNQGYQTVAWDGINYYPIFEIENRSVIKHWDFRPWAIHHLANSKWELKKIS